MSSPPLMRCPICQKPLDYVDGQPLPQGFPFCGERCKLIDLGRWLDGRYQIPVVEPDENDSAAEREDEV